MTTVDDPKQAIETFREAAELNLDDPLRKGSQIVFESYGQVVVTGDLHGHRRNFEKLVRYCALGTSPGRSIVLHELIHGEPDGPGRPDRSCSLLLDAARWKCEFPDQVFFLQSNHEVSQITGRGIVKSGRGVLEDFVAGVEAAYGAENTSGIMDAISTFILSYPLAARLPNGVFVSHSLPAPRDMDEFDPSVLNRRITVEDLKHSSAGKFLWGRRHPPELIEQLAEMLEVDIFILGHQPQPEGFKQIGERTLILSSDHNHGVFLPIDLSKPTTMPELVKKIRKLASIA